MAPGVRRAESQIIGFPPAKPTTPHPLPFRPSRPRACRRISTPWPIAPAITSRRRTPPILTVPTLRTGSILPAGADGRASRCFRPIHRSSGSTSRLKPPERRPATGDEKPNSVSTIERRLSALTWDYAQRGQPLNGKDRHIATVMAGIRNKHAAPPRQKEAVLPEDLRHAGNARPRHLRGLRDRAMLLLDFAGGLRRSEITGLDCGRDQTEDSSGWVEILDKGMLLRLRGKTGWREIEVGRGSSDMTCPVVALETWLKLTRIAHGPLFRRVTGQGRNVGANRLNDQEVARLIKRTALAAGVRGDLPEASVE